MIFIINMLLTDNLDFLEKQTSSIGNDRSICENHDFYDSNCTDVT